MCAMAEMDSTIILQFEAKTAAAEEKIKRLSATLSTEAGRAMTATQAKVKQLEAEVKKSQMSLTEMGSSMKTAWTKMLGPIAMVTAALGLVKKVFGTLDPFYHAVNIKALEAARAHEELAKNVHI